MDKPHVSIVVAIDKNRAIGHGNELLWHIPDDLKRFKALTLGHPIIMGRKTFESILGSLGKPLPGRTNIVVTHDTAWHHDGVIAANSIEEAIAKAKEIDDKEIFIGGGTQIYEQALPYCTKLYLTLIEDEKEGDTFFPSYKHLFTKKTAEEERDWNGLKYRFIDLERE